MKREMSKFSYIWLSSLLLMLLFGFVGTQVGVKKTYSAGTNCHMYNGKSICIDQPEYTIYGEYGIYWSGELPLVSWKTLSGFKFHAFDSNKTIFNKIRISWVVLGARLFYGNDKDEYQIAYRSGNTNAYNPKWIVLDDIDYSLQIEVIEPATLSKSDYEYFEKLTSSHNVCYYNESSDKFLWTNVEIGYPLPRYGYGFVDKEKCANQRMIILNDSTGNVTLGGSVSPHYYYLANGEKANIKSFYDKNKTHNYVREGYTLKWNTKADGTGTTYKHDESWTITKNVKLYAIWEPNHPDEYIVEYDANGGENVPSYQTKKHGESLTLRGGVSSELPTKDCYEFNSWNTSADGKGTKYIAGATYTLNENVKLYAQWDLITYKVLYNKNGGSDLGLPTTQDKTCGVDLTLADTYPAAADSCHVFDSWNTRVDGKGDKYDVLGTYDKDESVTLYADWSLITYNVKYDANGGTKAPSDVTKKCGIKIVLSGQKPVREGYTFIGWSTSKNGSVKYDAGSFYTADESVTLYAIWVKGDALSRCNIRDNPPTSDKMLVSIGLMILTFIGFGYFYFIVRRVKD